jgi:hypothetical protein
MIIRGTNSWSLKRGRKDACRDIDDVRPSGKRGIMDNNKDVLHDMQSEALL